MKKIVDILITQFYSEHYKFFWGVENTSTSMELGSDHTDFGHSVKTFWVILKVGELLGDPFYIDFARPKIDNIIHSAYIEEAGSWARWFDKNGNLDIDKEWWILAELDQACEILSIHDPYYYKYLNHIRVHSPPLGAYKLIPNEVRLGRIPIRTNLINLP